MGVDLRVSPEPSGWLKSLAQAKLPRAVTVAQAYQLPVGAWLGTELAAQRVFHHVDGSSSPGGYRSDRRLHDGQ